MPSMNTPGIKASDVWAGVGLKKYTLAKIHQANPVTSDWYTILDTTLNVILSYIIVKHTYTEARGLTIQITIDGVVMTSATIDVTNDENWFVYIDPTATAEPIVGAATTVIPVYQFIPLEGRSVKVEFRTLELIDGGAALQGAAHYHVREP
ncbi:unnamed protein product [marine sediment metagenome]|uniref:F5/8 type C domain-containing protein n=1 Tax=marine sediment metagenome TaxID=412755 RepID=X1RL67_9ZZZZ